MNYFDSYLATFVVVCFSLVLVFFYFVFEPYVKKPNVHWYWKGMSDLGFHVVMLSLALQILFSATWKIPNTWENLAYDIFLVRINNQTTTAHIWTYFLLPVFYFLSFRKTQDPWKSMLQTALLAFLHESIWFLYYYARYWSIINWSQQYLADLNFLILISTFALIYFKKYGLKGIKLPVGAIFFYNAAWYAEGFPITVMNNPFQATIYHQELWTNGTEILGWLIATISMLIWVHLYQEGQENR